jgi:hypothetical protein
MIRQRFLGLVAVGALSREGECVEDPVCLGEKGRKLVCRQGGVVHEHDDRLAPNAEYDDP